MGRAVSPGTTVLPASVTGPTAAAFKEPAASCSTAPIRKAHGVEGEGGPTAWGLSAALSAVLGAANPLPTARQRMTAASLLEESAPCHSSEAEALAAFIPLL